MHIAVVHSYYSSQQPSGESVAVDAQVDVLRSAGHTVSLLAQRTDERERASGYALRAAANVITGRGASPLPALDRLSPDVVHVHNLFPNWGTRWLDHWEGPVVATLHNYRPMCAAGTLLRDGSLCTLCPDGDAWAGVKHHCYRDSAIKTVPLAVKNRRGVTTDRVVRRADALIVLAPRTRDIYQRYGVPTARMHLIPNFVPTPPAASSQRNGRWVFVGRLTKEKGLLELLTGWPADQPIDIVGDGPLADQVRSALPTDSRFLGARSQQEVQAILPSYEGLVLPSRSPESAVSLVAIESLAAGVPVVALSGNAAADLIAEAACGVVVTDGGDWAAALREVAADREAYSDAARQVYARRFRPESWLAAITGLYTHAITDRST